MTVAALPLLQIRHTVVAGITKSFMGGTVLIHVIQLIVGCFMASQLCPIPESSTLLAVITIILQHMVGNAIDNIRAHVTEPQDWIRLRYRIENLILTDRSKRSGILFDVVAFRDRNISVVLCYGR